MPSSWPGTKFDVKSNNLKLPLAKNSLPVEFVLSSLKIMSPSVLLVIQMMRGATVKAVPTAAYVPDIPV